MGKTHLMLQTLFDRFVDSESVVLYCDASHTFNQYCLAQQVLSELRIISKEEDVWSCIASKLSTLGNVYLAIDNAECNPNTIREIIPTLLAQVPNLTVIMTNIFPMELEDESTLFLTHLV